MSKILLVVYTPGAQDQNCVALIPSEYLQEVDFDAINFKILNDGDVGPKEAIMIVNIYKRLGLEKSDNEQDLKPFINPQPPFAVDKVVMIGWAM